MKIVLACFLVVLAVAGSFVALRMSAPEPESEPEKPLVQPVWKTRPKPKRPAPQVAETEPGIKTYKTGEMIDMGKSRFGDKSETRGPIYANRRQYDMEYGFQRSDARSEAPIQSRRSSNGQVKSHVNR